MRAPLPQTRRALALATLGVLVVFGGLVAAITMPLRRDLRAEVLRREAEAIDAVAQMEMAEVTRAAPAAGPDELFTAVLKSTRLRGVFAVQLFDASGALREALPIFPQQSPTPDWPIPLEQPLARFDPAGSWDAAYGLNSEPGQETRRPLLEVFVPLRPAAAQAVGVARYWLDGAGVDAEFNRLDARLTRQAGLAFGGGALLIALVLAAAFSQLAQANEQLSEQSADLARANQELDFAAKTGAIGAITAHLIHGLKNPLSGLEGFVAENAPDTADLSRGEAWRTAVDTTHRLRALVNEVTTVLRDEASGAGDYRVPVREVLAAAQARFGSAARAAGVELTSDAGTAGGAALLGRTTGLVSLILANLAGNAIEASPRGARVRIEARRSQADVEFLVTDQGPGLPEVVRAGLFRPLRSTKAGGGGIGLAISAQLAKHAGGELSLVRSDATGTVFRLVVPGLPGEA